MIFCDVGSLGKIVQVSGYLMLVSMQFHCRCFPTWKCRSSRFLRGAHEFPTTKERTTTRHMSSLAVAVSASLVMYSGSTASSKACWDLFWRRCIAVTNRNGRKHLRGEKKMQLKWPTCASSPRDRFFFQRAQLIVY